MIGTLDNELLESIVDRHGLRFVLEQLADICNGNAEHVRSNWQDEPLARLWERAARAIQGAANKVRS